MMRGGDLSKQIFVGTAGKLFLWPKAEMILDTATPTNFAIKNFTGVPTEICFDKSSLRIIIKLFTKLQVNIAKD